MYIRLYMLMRIWFLLLLIGIILIGYEILWIGISLTVLGLLGCVNVYFIAQGINIKEKIKHKLWHILIWTDNNINHKYFEKIFGLQESNIGYYIWKHTSRAYCNFVFDHEHWDIDRKTQQELADW